MNTNDAADDRGLFALFKGDSGTGKTVGALSFPNVKVMDFDRKMPAIARKHFPGKSIEYTHYEDIFKVSDDIESMTLSCPYETLIIDSITSLVNLTLSSIAGVKNESTTKMLQSLRGSKGKTIELMSIDYYNGETRFMQWFLDQMKALHSKQGNPKHVILVAHVITSESAPDLKTKLVTRTSSIVTAGRKVAAYIPTQFDDMWHFGFERPELGDDGKSRHVVLTETHGTESAKTAYNLPEKIDFTDGNLYDIWSKATDGSVARQSTL